MRIKFDLTLNSNARVVWVAVCLCLLQIGVGSLSASPALLPGLLLVLTLMLTLSFPLSLLPVLVLDDLIGPEVPPIVEFSVLWFCMFVSGFVQWFVLLPWLARPQFTTLGLSTQSPRRPRRSRRRRRRVRKRPNHIAPTTTHYDVNGMSPLERAFLEQ